MNGSNRHSKHSIPGLKPYQDKESRRKAIHEHLARTVHGRRDLNVIKWKIDHGVAEDSAPLDRYFSDF